MAEPLTSTDIIRERMGFGPSDLASTNTRRAYMEAGLSPLGTKERERFEEGRGLSPMASQQEKQAWVAAEVMTGKRNPMDLPEAYGGLGERPEATTRRGLRMQEEWDKQYAMMMEQQKVARETEDNAKRLEILQRDQELQESDYYYNRGLKEAEQKLQLEQRSQAANIVNGMNQIDPRSPDFRQGVAELFGKNPLGSKDQGALEVASKYAEVNSLYEQTQKERDTEKNWLVNQQEEASSLNVDTTKFIKTDPQTGEITEVDQLGLSKAIGEAKRNDIETKKKEVDQSKIADELKDQARSVLDEINKTDTEIRKANFNASREKSATKRDEFISNAEFLQNERNVLVDRFNKLMPQPEQEQQPVAGQAPQVELSERDQAAIDWANANPDDPRSQRIKQRLGVQ